ADDWAVTPDGVAPIEGPRPLFAMPAGFGGTGTALQFAGPGSEHAALVGQGRNGRRWLRYDLRKPPYPVEEVSLARDSYDRHRGGHRVLSLSPDGKWLAGALDTEFVSLWGTTGEAVGQFFTGAENRAKPERRGPRSEFQNYSWTGFTDNA